MNRLDRARRKNPVSFEDPTLYVLKRLRLSHQEPKSAKPSSDVFIPRCRASRRTILSKTKHFKLWKILQLARQNPKPANAIKLVFIPRCGNPPWAIPSKTPCFNSLKRLQLSRQEPKFRRAVEPRFHPPLPHPAVHNSRRLEIAHLAQIKQLSGYL